MTETGFFENAPPLFIFLWISVLVVLIVSGLLRISVYASNTEDTEHDDDDSSWDSGSDSSSSSDDD